MSEAFTPLSVGEAIAAAHRIFERADSALSLRRALTGVPDREMISIVILARQLDEIARTAAALKVAANSPESVRSALADHLTELLTAGGFLPPSDLPLIEEHAHGEG